MHVYGNGAWCVVCYCELRMSMMFFKFIFGRRVGRANYHLFVELSVSWLPMFVFFLIVMILLNLFWLELKNLPNVRLFSICEREANFLALIQLTKYWFFSHSAYPFIRETFESLGGEKTTSIFPRVHFFFSQIPFTTLLLRWWWRVGGQILWNSKIERESIKKRQSTIDTIG